MFTIPETIDFVYGKFAGKFRKGTIHGELIPAALHSFSVFHAAYRYGITSPVALKAFLCHDIIEDTDTTIDELRDKIGDEATNVVIGMTFDPKDVPKHLYIDSFRQKSTIAIVGKAIDRLENVKDFCASTPAYAVAYLKKADSIFSLINERRDEIIELFGAKVVDEIATTYLKLQSKQPEVTLRNLPIIEQVLPVFETLTPEQRVAVFVAIFYRYCRDCGQEHPQDSICQCNNEE